MMSNPTLKKTLPLPSERPTWPQDVGTRFARGEATRPTMPFVRRDEEEGPIEIEWTATGRDGETHDFFQVFRTVKSLPGPTADKVMMALLSMSPGPINENLQVETHLNELAGLCRIKKGESTRKQLLQATDRLYGVTIETNAFWDQAEQTYPESSMISLFSSHAVNSGPENTEVHLRLTSAAGDLMSTWTKPVNLNHLSGLDSCLARKLYQVSALAIYQQGKMVEDLKILCHEHLGISRSQEHPSQLNCVLREPIKSLREKNLIDIRSKKDAEDPSFESDWVVRARPMKKMLEAEEEIEDPQC